MKSVSMKNNKAYLKWSKSENADGYVVYRRIGKTGKYKKIKTINSGNTLKYSLAACVLPFIAGDSIKIAAATLVAEVVRSRVIPAVTKHKSY